MAKKSLNLEQKLIKLEELASLVESGEIPISDIIKIHKESVDLIKECREEISQIENVIINHKV